MSRIDVTGAEGEAWVFTDDPVPLLGNPVHVEVNIQPVGEDPSTVQGVYRYDGGPRVVHMDEDALQHLRETLPAGRKNGLRLRVTEVAEDDERGKEVAESATIDVDDVQVYDTPPPRPFLDYGQWNDGSGDEDGNAPIFDMDVESEGDEGEAEGEGDTGILTDGEIEQVLPAFQELAQDSLWTQSSPGPGVQQTLQIPPQPKLGTVVQASFNMNHLGEPTTIPDVHMDWVGSFDQGYFPPNPTSAEQQGYFDKAKKAGEMEGEGKKEAKIAAVLSALRGAEKNGHPIDIASFHEVNDMLAFATGLLENAASYGVTIVDGDDPASENATTGYVLHRGPWMRTGNQEANRVQNENYPILVRADKFALEKVQQIPTYGDDRGKPSAVPPRGKAIGTPAGKPRPLILYTLKSKEPGKEGAPPLKVAVVHTKPGGSSKQKGKDDIVVKQRRDIWQQVKEAYKRAAQDAKDTGALWTFIGDHYLANNEIVNKKKDTFQEKVSGYGLTPFDPAANTNTTEKVQTDLGTLTAREKIRELQKLAETARKKQAQATALQNANPATTQIDADDPLTLHIRLPPPLAEDDEKKLAKLESWVKNNLKGGWKPDTDAPDIVRLMEVSEGLEALLEKIEGQGGKLDKAKERLNEEGTWQPTRPPQRRAALQGRLELLEAYSVASQLLALSTAGPDGAGPPGTAPDWLASSEDWLTAQRQETEAVLDGLEPSRDDRSGASYMDKKRAQVADKAVVTQNMPVVQGGIVTLRPADSEGDPTMNEAGRFLAEDPHNEELARTAAWSDHAMLLLITSDDPDDAGKVAGMFDDKRPPKRKRDDESRKDEEEEEEDDDSDEEEGNDDGQNDDGQNDDGQNDGGPNDDDYKDDPMGDKDDTSELDERRKSARTSLLTKRPTAPRKKASGPPKKKAKTEEKPAAGGAKEGPVKNTRVPSVGGDTRQRGTVGGKGTGNRKSGANRKSSTKKTPAKKKTPRKK